MMRWRAAFALLAVLPLVSSPRASAQTNAPAPRVAIVDEPPDTAVAALDAAGTLPYPVAVRVDAGDAGDVSTGARAEKTLSGLASRHIPIWLALPAPDSAGVLEPWRARLRAYIDRFGESLSIVEIDADRQPADVLRFAVQIAATEIGATRPGVRVAIGGPAMLDEARRRVLYAADLAAYLDLLAIPADRIAGAGAWLRGVDAQASLALMPPVSMSGPNADGPDSFVRHTLEQLGTETAIRAWRPADVPASALRAFAALPTLLTHSVLVEDDKSVSLAFRRDGNDASSVRHRVLFDAETFASYLVFWEEAGAPGTSLTATLSVPPDGAPEVHDLSAGTRAAAAGREIANTGRRELTLPSAGHTMVVDLTNGATAFVDRAGVTAETQLSVDEIVARHRRQQRAQDAALRSYTAHARMEQHFRPTLADPGYDVVSENTYFSARDGVEWRELSFAVNGAKWGARRPPFPILQPEKVLALPLQLRFDEGYRYRLAGTERAGEYDCYVVKFEPIRQDSALYSGTVWIDRRTFARIKVHAVQSGLPAPVISNDETYDYALTTRIGAQPIFLFSGLSAKQILLVAGRNLLVEKRVTFTDFHVNTPEFEEEREAARSSQAVMFRDTPQGLRYYVPQDGKRVIADQPQRDLKALAMGVTIDPSYDFPLPMFGIDYINFRVRNQETQLALLFAGVLAAGNIQRSHIGAKNLDGSLDFFAIAAPASDRVYGEHGEDPATRLLTWPLSTGLNFGWQASPFQKATLQYQLRFDAYVRDRTTSPDFIVPASTLTNGFGGAWEYRRRGYSFVSNGAWYRRASWHPFGFGEVSSPEYAKYGASLSRDFFLDAFRKIHVNGSWFSGWQLDRFNTYQFGMFDDTRVHGIPASGVKLGEMALARGSYSLNIFEQYRIDVFAEHAWGRDVPGSGPWQAIPAFGIAVNTRAPWDTILRVDAGKSFLPGRYDTLGSFTLQVLLLKPLR